MNELSKFLVESIMEDKNPIKKTVVIYVGRFQPMHKGHAGTYQHLVKKFGKDNVYVGTSDKVQLPKSPFNFKEKVKIMTTMFGIPKSKIHKVRDPYKPTEILKKFDEETTAFVTVVGEKDKSRLRPDSGKYFQTYKGDPSEGYRDRGYVYAAPMSGGAVSGTEVRNGLSVGSDEQKKNFFKKRAYGKFNATIFSMITDKLDEGIEISKEMIEEWLLNESSKMGSGQADDGPNFMFPNYDVFSKINVERAKRIGYEVVNMITTKELEDYYDHPTYPNGPVKAVTPFPAGVLGTTTATNQVDIYSSDAYSKWFKHVTRKAALVGYELVKGLDINKDEKEQSLDSQKGDKKAQEEYEASLNENIVLPIKVGDTIMTGRFKNKKTVVKTIGKDEHGMPTINGRKVVTFRMVKEGFISELAGTEVKCEKCNHQWEIESDDSEKYLCHSCGWDSQKGEYDFDAFDSWKEKMGLNEELDERGKMRPADKLRRKAAMAGKKAQIARRRARTMKRRKPLSKLKKIAYKMAYRQVYDEFLKDLFPDKKKSDLTIKQSQVVHKNVVRKKGRIMKRAKFRFLPALRQKEFDKFQGKKQEDVVKESLPTKVTDKFKSVKSSKPSSEAEKDFNKHHTYSSYAKRGSIAEPDTIDFDDDGKLGGHQEKEKDTKKRGYEPIEESLKELGITDFKSLFKKMPSDLQKRVYNLKNFGQRVDKHPEGNVLKHTIVVVNRSIKEDDIDIAIAAMFHDIGKDETAGIHPKKGHITHFGHEKVSASLVKKYKKFIESVGGNPANVFYIVKNHMRYKQLSVMTPKKVNKLKSFRAFDKLGKFSKHDRSGLDESKNFKLRVPSDIIKIQKGFKKNGKKLYVVGGAVRDAILGKSPKDFDLATDAKPDEVLKIAKDLGMKTVEVGKSFGVVMVGGHEIATFRKDIGKGRRPSSVDYTDIEGDVRRRDLTINALFYDIDRKEIVDLVGGIADLKKKNIRTVGKASERFDEDPLRKLRALRFQARLGGNLDKELLDALQKDPSLKGVSFERVRDEVIKSIKSAKDTKKYMELNDKIGFTSLIFPNLKISKPYIKDNDYILFIASLLKKNSPSVLGKQLNKLTYSNDEKNNIVFLVSLQHFRPEEIVVFKKLQQKTSLSDDQILKFGKLIGKDMKKFVNFNLSIGGKDAPSDIKGPEIGLWIKNKEKEKFMNEIEQLISDIDNKLVEMFLPNTKTPQQLIKENINESKLLQEGGAYGHMSHPFDTDINLTFGQLKDIVNRALEGTLEFTREKTDGQALAISWRDGRLVAARNKGHLKNRGENALDIQGVSDKFQGRGGLSDAYNYAMKDLSNAIKSLNDKQRDKIFKQGACFMNLEVIYPTSVNVIPYGQALLVFHGTMEFNEEGVAIGENGDAARILAGMIKQVNKDVQDSYTIKGPPVVKLPKSQDLSKKRSKYSSQISKLQKEFGLKDTDGVANYHQSWWEQWVDKNSPSTLDNKTKMGLVKRWAFMDKGFRLDKKNITDEKTLEWAKKTDKDDQKKIGKKNLMKFEQIFLGLGAEVLEFTSSALTVNPDSAVRDMKKRIDKTIKDVKKSGDPKKIEKLKLELGRLNSIGGSKKIVPNEGIVFLYKGNTFKLTGTFASVNQILGIFF
jgi:tRNA nucleotidyltransferase/poly(A) polymerase/Zn finger protein HypA/HybF involved in hydrogenase expression